MLEQIGGEHPYLVAARWQIARRRQAEAQATVLRRALGQGALRLPFLFDGPEAPGGLDTLADELAAGMAA
jgi:hypothetical protein